MTKINVLDKGFIELVDVLGSDLTVVNAARVSFGKRKTELDSSDEKLIKYLASHEHLSPFRNCQIQFHCKVPEFVARQWYKHCIGTEYSIGSKDHGWNEISGRYVDASEFEFNIPTEYRKQSKSNKQCSTDELVSNSVDCSGTSFMDLNGWSRDYNQGDEVIPYSVSPEDIVQNVTDMCMEAYNLLVKHGVAKEQARMILPLNFYTEFYWTASLQAVTNFIQLRDHEGSQYEIREYAKAMRKLVEEKFPISLKYLLEDNNEN
jgi:thymidylate synthase (FAD)